MAIRLSRKRRVFAEEYLKCGNQSEAARRAGYKNEAVMGSRLMKVKEIGEYIDKRLTERAMETDEVIARLSDMARANIGDVIVITESGDRKVWKLDIEKIKNLGPLVKKVKETQWGIEVEFHNSQNALVQLAKLHGLYEEKIKITDWRDELIEMLREGKIEPEIVRSELGNGLAEELFKSAGVQVNAGGEDSVDKSS